MNESISVIIPAYNAEAFIDRAIQSVLGQTHKVSEIIIVNDGSTDNTKSVSAQYPVTLISTENFGVAAARNTGLKKASCQYVSFLDADDMWLPHKIEHQMEIFKKDPKTDLVLGLVNFFNQSGGQISEDMFVTHLGCLLAKRKVFDRVGFFDENFSFGEDTDWFIRSMEQDCQTHILNEVVLQIYRHSHNMTGDRRSANLYLVRALKQSLDRRRASNAEEISELAQLNIPKTKYSK